MRAFNKESNVGRRDNRSSESKVIKQKIYIKNMNSKILLVIILIGIIVGSIFYFNNSKTNKASIYTKSTLKEIIMIEELSSYRITYQGIAKKYDYEKNKEGKVINKKLKYSCCYDSKIDLGIDVKKIDVSVKGKDIIVKLPEVIITNKEVDIGSLDIIKNDSNMEEESIISEAFGLSEDDLEKEINSTPKIKEMAKENAKKIITGLLETIVEQDGYKVIVK